MHCFYLWVCDSCQSSNLFIEKDWAWRMILIPYNNHTNFDKRMPESYEKLLLSSNDSLIDILGLLLIHFISLPSADSLAKTDETLTCKWLRADFILDYRIFFWRFWEIMMTSFTFRDTFKVVTSAHLSSFYRYVFSLSLILNLRILGPMVSSRFGESSPCCWSLNTLRPIASLLSHRISYFLIS